MATKIFAYILPICREAPLGGIYMKFCMRGHLADVINRAKFYFSDQGFWFCGGSNFWLSHKKEKSPLTQGLNYCSACDVWNATRNAANWPTWWLSDWLITQPGLRQAHPVRVVVSWRFIHLFNVYSVMFYVHEWNGRVFYVLLCRLYQPPCAIYKIMHYAYAIHCFVFYSSGYSLPRHVHESSTGVLKPEYYTYS